MKNLKTIDKINHLISNNNSSSYFNIGVYIKENILVFENLSIKDIAEKTFTSEATISRFSQELGFSGFREFKWNLLSEIKNDKNKYPENYKSQIDEELDIVQNNINFFRKNKNLIANVAELIFKAKKIYIYGFGGNANIIKIFHHYLIRMGLESIYLSDRDDQVAYSMLSKSEDVNFLISYRFRDKRWTKILENIKKGTNVFITTEKRIEFDTNDSDSLIEIPFNEGHRFERDHSEISFLMCLMLIVEELMPKNNLYQRLKKQDVE